jgi:hypothetical protein
MLKTIKITVLQCECGTIDYEFKETVSTAVFRIWARSASASSGSIRIHPITFVFREISILFPNFTTVFRDISRNKIENFAK